METFSYRLANLLVRIYLNVQILFEEVNQESVILGKEEGYNVKCTLNLSNKNQAACFHLHFLVRKIFQNISTFLV